VLTGGAGHDRTTKAVTGIHTHLDGVPYGAAMQLGYGSLVGCFESQSGLLREKKPALAAR